MNFGVRGNELGNHWMIWNFSQKNFSSNLICFEIQQTSIQIFLYINLFYRHCHCCPVKVDKSFFETVET